MTKVKHKRIYVLRAQCEHHNLDKMKVFYRLPNIPLEEMWRGNEEHLTVQFRGKYECDHDIKFTREIDRNYVWDMKSQKAVKIHG